MKKITYKVKINPLILGENINLKTLQGYVKDKINEVATRYCRDTGESFRIASIIYDETKVLVWFVDVLYFPIDVSIANKTILSSEYLVVET